MSIVYDLISIVMKTLLILPLLLVGLILSGCNSTSSESATSEVAAEKDLGQAAVDEDSDPNILKIAIGSADHSTLVAAVQAAGIEHVLANNGPITVFAPTNAAFEALPEGTVETLLKPENKSQLIDILYYHASPGTYVGDLLTDGRQIYQANGDNVEIKVQDDGNVTVNGANIVATIPASNGAIHVIDAVLLPPQ